MDTTTRANHSDLVGALVLIGLGVLFLLDKFWVWHFSFRKGWPLIMIGLGVWMLAQRRRRAGMGPMFLILMGAFFFARNLDWIDWRMRDFWPVLLIAMGAWMLLQRSRLFGTAQPTK